MNVTQENCACWPVRQIAGAPVDLGAFPTIKENRLRADPEEGGREGPAGQRHHPTISEQADVDHAGRCRLMISDIADRQVWVLHISCPPRLFLASNTPMLTDSPKR